MPSSRAPRPGSQAGAPGTPRPRPATPTDVSAAIEQRRRREARRRRLVLAGVAALLALALVLVWVVRFSPVLAVRQVRVEGTRMLQPSQVLQVADVPLGTPLVSLDTAPIGQRVAASLTQVEKVQVREELPHTVVVEVTERTAVYQRRVGSQYQSVDSHGVIFATASRPTKGLLVATTPGVDNRLLASVATVVATLPQAVRGRVQSVQADTPDQIVLTLDKGQRVLWGSAEQSELKAQVLVVLLGQKATVFDVSSPGSPSIR